MSQFAPKVFFDKYRVSTQPNDWIRPWLRIPKLNFCLLPYFNGADISLKMSIEPIQPDELPEAIEYDLRLYKKVIRTLRSSPLLTIKSLYLTNIRQ